MERHHPSQEEVADLVRRSVIDLREPRRERVSQEEVADLVRRSEMPAAIWAAFLVAACMSAVFDERTEPGASRAGPVCPASGASAV